MAFSEALKLTLKKRAHFRCCLCHELIVEIHHIVPQSENGSDDEDNAAPLCPTCHDTYGANPVKRKFIREARDFWYEICEKRIITETSQIKDVVVEALKGIATKEDLERLSVQNSAYVLGRQSEGGSITLEQLRYSFVREEYIRPQIVQELYGWLSDPNATIISVDLISANRSNRFHGEFWVRKIENGLWVGWTHDKEEFAYSYIATSPSGVHMVQCSYSGGGSGTFNSVLLFAFDRDRALDHEASGTIFTRERILLKILGSVSLGDRYVGKISYDNGVLAIGPDQGWFERGEAAAKTIPIR